ncbi:MAG TPA: hypothetical protein VL992_16565 [Tepidisphaeraceae bacterium]|nr:hypothetical protein [Tepidisphaeraceae bacterium]
MSSDPSDYRQYEQEFVQHVEKLLTDDRLRIDTLRGRRAATTLIRDVSQSDGFAKLTDLMKEMNCPDRDLRNRMPVGQTIEVTLSQKRWFVLRKLMGRMKIVCVSPWRALLKDEPPPPMSRAELAELLSRNPPEGGVPTTVVVMSTSGFAIEAHELTERRTDRTVILVSPISGGGWKVVGPPETKALADLFDPEAEAEKKRRIREAIEAGRAELAGSGLASDRIAARTQLSPLLVEAELKQYAKEKPGLAARRLDGKMVLYRQSAVATEPSSGGVDMPLIDHIKALFARKGETEKKIAFLAERRAALGQQRDRGYEEIGDLETREADLRKQFGETSGELTKRRITSQLLQLHKDIERRQQLQSVLNQQINVVSTALHNLELVQQGKAAQLPDGDELAADAAAAEEVMAELQANNELAESVGGTIQGGMSAEEQALYEELEKATRPAPAAPVDKDEAAVTMAPPPQKAPPPAAPAAQRKATPEAG